MKAEFVNAFLAPAVDVWRKELGQALEFTGAEVVPGTFTSEDITAIIGVTGRLKGTVFYEFSQATAMSVAAHMLGTSLPALDEMSLSALGELANMVTGNATTQLAEASYPCDISPPVLLPRGAAVSAATPQIRAHFACALGPMSIRIGLTEVAH